jgi:serine/threonine protein kinase
MADLAAGNRVAGYVIEGMIARGGMGVVYRARQLRPSRLVAVKVISPELASDRDFRRRFERETEIAASIEHSNVIPVYGVGEESHLLYLAMRYVEGTDLRSVIAAEGRLAPRRAAQLLTQLTAALDAAHNQGLVHRDVKPANVLIGQEHVYLTDFGLAKLAASRGQTRTGTFVGTLDYAAPEQFEGRRVDARTDVYAAGCVLYHMLTGQVPFPREGDAALMLAHLSAPPPSVRATVPTAPAQLDDVIARAMAKDPAARYQSAGDLGRDGVAAAEAQRATLIERSIATGLAAPTEVDTPGAAAGLQATVPDRAAADRKEPGPPSRPRPGARTAAIAGASLVVIALAIVVATGALGGGSPHKHSATHSSATNSTPSPSTPTTKTYANPGLGVGFSYPAGWEALTLKGAAADFGINPGPAETRCALVVERGVAPASNSQEAQFAYVRARSASAASKAKHYQLLAIEADQGANIAGVGLLRIDDGQGGHLGFFFRGRDVYLFDCITPAVSLTRVDRQDFRPLLASVRIT